MAEGYFGAFLVCGFLFCCLFLFITWIAYFDLQRNTEDFDEVVYYLKVGLLIKVFLCLNSESVGTSQFPNPPFMIRITMKKIMTKAWAVTIML